MSNTPWHYPANRQTQLVYLLFKLQENETWQIPKYIEKKKKKTIRMKVWYKLILFYFLLAFNILMNLHLNLSRLLDINNDYKKESDFQ